MREPHVEQQELVCVGRGQRSFTDLVKTAPHMGEQ